MLDVKPVNSIILTGTIPCDGKLKPKMSQSAAGLANVDATTRHHARVRDLRLTSKLAVMACRKPETDVQTLHSPSYATADVRLHFFAAK